LRPKYLEWEINSVKDMAIDDHRRFQVAVGRVGIRHKKRGWSESDKPESARNAGTSRKKRALGSKP